MPALNDNLLARFIKHPNPIKDKGLILVRDDFYQKLLLNFDKLEIEADFVIFNYQMAIMENRYLAEHYPFISENFWLIGQTGQGDDWLIHKSTHQIYYYNHDNDEYSKDSDLLNLQIHFNEFIQLAFLYKDYQNCQNYPQCKLEFISLSNQIKQGILADFPIDLSMSINEYHKPYYF